MHPSQYKIIWRGKETRKYFVIQEIEVVLFIAHTYMGLKLPSPNSLLPICHNKFVYNIWKENTQKEKRICDMSPMKK
jgi:hypothetical protein